MLHNFFFPADKIILCSSDRFGKGFTVKMYLAGSSYDVDMISNFMQQNFPSTFLKVRKRKKKACDKDIFH